MKTKQQTVIEQLIKRGEVSRNWCLARHITRLSAIIKDLVETGWKFDSRPSGTGQCEVHGKFKNGDYVYEVVNIPKKYARK